MMYTNFEIMAKIRHTVPKKKKKITGKGESGQQIKLMWIITVLYINPILDLPINTNNTLNKIMH